MKFEAFFLPASSGQRFCVFHPPDPQVARCGAVVYVHPFAEEMNKSRRMAALQAKTMAAHGYAVLQIDLHGCGDSSGDFGDASWAGWIDDVTRACDWLQQRFDLPLWLWGLRTGCLVAVEVANQIGSPARLLLWQPVVSGKQFLQQFLRLKIAGELLSGEGKGVMDRLRQQLAHGESVEVAGYTLSAALANGLENAELAPSGKILRIEWIEVSSKPDAVLSPLASAKLERWTTIGHEARGSVVCGPAFWQTTEISECPELLNASLLAMTGRAQA